MTKSDHEESERETGRAKASETVCCCEWATYWWVEAKYTLCPENKNDTPTRNLPCLACNVTRTFRQHPWKSLSVSVTGIGLIKNARSSSITRWVVAITCYISHSAKHRKMADFNPSGSQNPWTDFDETWHGWLCLGSHPTRQTGHVGEVVQRGWSWQICDLSHLWVSFLFFFFWLPLALIAWPTVTSKRVFPANDVIFEVSTVSYYIWGSNSQKTSLKWARILILQRNQRSSIITIYRSFMMTLASNLTDRLTVWNIIEEIQN